MKKGLIIGACFLFIVLMLSFISAGFFSGLFKKATITGHDIGGGENCYDCIISYSGKWCEDGFNSFCKYPWNMGGACGGTLITSKVDCPCPASCDDVYACYGWQCGDCWGNGYDMPLSCYINCGTCGTGFKCSPITHTCVLDCMAPNYEISRQVDEASETCKDDDLNDLGCCSGIYDCVVDGECFASDVYHQPPANHLCGGDSGEYCYRNTWYNEKSSLPENMCVGDFGWVILSRVINPADPDGEAGYFTDSTDEGCCKDDTYCVINGYCYRSAEERPIDINTPYFDGYYYTISSQGKANPNPLTDSDALSGPGSGEACFNNVWYDEIVDIPNYCGNIICERTNSETCATCPYDCGACPDCVDDGDCGDLRICCDNECREPSCSSDAGCDDNLDCTTDTCVNNPGTCDAVCDYASKADNTTCDGGVCCDGVCETLECTAGSCTDGGLCETGTCNNIGKCNAHCSYSSTADNEPCGVAGDSICCGGSCNLKKTVSSCTGNNDCINYGCTAPGTCDAVCTEPPKNNGATCTGGKCCNGDCCSSMVCCGSPGSCCASGELCCSGSCATPSCALGTCTGANDCKTYTCSNAGTCSASCSSPNKADNDPCTSVTGGVCHDGTCAAPSCSSNSDCDDSIPCTTDTCSNPGDWDADCNNVDITTCIDNDDCCPSGCNSDTDNDCSLHCGDGTSNYGETCITCPADVSCASGEYCNPTTELCVSGCGNDADCSGATPKCSASHVCVECVNAATDCGADEVCTNGNCVIGMCGYNVIDGAHFVFSVAADRARAAKFMKNIQAECGVTFEAEISNTLPTGYSGPTGQKNILILNITVSDPTNINGADLSFIINQSELITQAISEVIIYVEDDTETTGWKSLVPGADISAVSGSLEMFNYKVRTPHFSLFLITEPELCGNGVFDSAHEECDASITGVTHCTGCVCDVGYNPNGTGYCEPDPVDTECSVAGDEDCTGVILYECGSDLKWDSKGVVLGKCGVECYPVGNMSCQGEIPLRCGTDYQWDLQSRVSGLCGYVLDPLGGGGIPGDRCGNGYCNYDEDEFSCPEDCAPASGGEGEPNWGLIALVVGIAILVLIIIIVLFKIFNKERRGPMAPNRRLPPAHRPGPKREPGRPVEHSQPVGRPAVGQGAYPKRRYPAR